MEPRAWQRRARDAVLGHHASAPQRGALIVAATGCHEAGTKVLMHDGSTKAVEDVVVGDVVMGPDSGPRHVKNLCHGRDEMWEVRPVKGDPWRINPDHVLTVRLTPRRAGDSPETIDITARDALRQTKFWWHRAKLIRTGVALAGSHPGRIQPYLLGAILGDGHIADMVRICKPDRELIDEVARLSTEIGTTTSEFHYEGRCPGISIHSIIPDLRELGLSNARSGDKFIPPAYLATNRTARLELLAGLIDTDGHLSNGVYDYITKSRRLSDDIVFLCRSLGFAAYATECRKGCQNGFVGDYHRICISGDLNLIPCRIPRRRAPARKQKKDVLVTGFSVVPLGYQADYYGFTLDADQRYLLGDFTVTHNSGKTAGAHYILDHWLSQGKRTLWVAAQDELVFQPERTLRRWWPQYTSGIVKAARDEPNAQATYASVATLTRSPKRLDAILRHGIDVVVFDECHESLGRSQRKLISRLDSIGIYRMGLTATPERGDGQALAELWDLVFDYPILDAIDDGCIVNPYLAEFRLPGLDLSRVAVGRGDYLPADLERELVRNHVVEHTVKALSQSHNGVKLPFNNGQMTFDPRAGGILVHTVSVDQAKATAEALCEAGWVARAVWGEMPKGDRARVIAQFGKGIQVLCSPAALAQGTDLPFAQVNVLARPTRSRRLYIQIFGRVLRPFDGKEGGLMLDLVGAAKLHSLVSAPILISGHDCPEADDGKHVYLEGSHGSAWCQNCGHKIACVKSGGPHRFKAGACKDCGAPQCKQSPDRHHHWIPWGSGARRCVHCALEIKDRMFSLVSGAHPHKEPVAWMRLPIGDPNIWAVDLGKVGKLFNVPRGELWEPLWFAGDKFVPLSNGPVSAELSRLVTDDVARQATRVGGRYGARGAAGGAQISWARLEHLAKKLQRERG